MVRIIFISGNNSKNNELPDLINELTSCQIVIKNDTERMDKTDWLSFNGIIVHDSADFMGWRYALDDVIQYGLNIPAIILSNHLSVTESYHPYKGIKIILKNTIPQQVVVDFIGNILNGSIIFPPHAIIKNHESLAKLSERQMEVLQLIAEGKSEKQICRELTISQGTVKKHTESIFRKLNVHKRTQAAIIYHQNNR